MYKYGYSFSIPSRNKRELVPNAYNVMRWLVCVEIVTTLKMPVEKIDKAVIAAHQSYQSRNIMLLTISTFIPPVKHR